MENDVAVALRKYSSAPCASREVRLFFLDDDLRCGPTVGSLQKKPRSGYANAADSPSRKRTGGQGINRMHFRCDLVEVDKVVDGDCTVGVHLYEVKSIWDYHEALSQILVNGLHISMGPESVEKGLPASCPGLENYEKGKRPPLAREVYEKIEETVVKDRRLLTDLLQK